MTNRPWVRAALAMFAVGWGANQFSSLLLAYREHAQLSASSADALFGIYAVGLIPALLVVGPLSDRLGRQQMARAAVLTSMVATGVLTLGAASTWFLYPGRLIAGIASGLIFAPGTAWVKELSAPPYSPAGAQDAGARRAAVALSAGFCLGPFVAGVVSQWVPAPLVSPYLPHLVVAMVAGVLVWNVPETVAAQLHSEPASLRVRSASSGRFRGVVAPLAPWVFIAASVSITLGPALVAERTGSVQIAFAGLIAGLTLGTGVLVQPIARRLDARSDVLALVAGLVAIAAGCLVLTITVHTPQPVLVVLAAVLMGAGYGFCLVAGLSETQQIAGRDELAALTAVFYALTYSGFAAPLVLTELGRWLSYQVLLPGVGALALVTLGAVLAAVSSRERSGDAPGRSSTQ